jgi:hypothetical protein
MNREKTVLGWKKDLADWDPPRFITSKCLN